MLIYTSRADLSAHLEAGRAARSAAFRDALATLFGRQSDRRPTIRAVPAVPHRPMTQALTA